MCMLLPLICWKDISRYPCATAMNRNFSTGETLFRHCPVLYGPVVFMVISNCNLLGIVYTANKAKQIKPDGPMSFPQPPLVKSTASLMGRHQGPCGSIPLLGDAASADLLGKSMWSVRLILLQSF